MAEVTELFMAAQGDKLGGKGWFAPDKSNEQSTGEGLSHFLTQQFQVVTGMGINNNGVNGFNNGVNGTSGVAGGGLIAGGTMGVGVGNGMGVTSGTGWKNEAGSFPEAGTPGRYPAVSSSAARYFTARSAARPVHVI